MSEVIIPEEKLSSDVVEKVEPVVEQSVEVPAEPETAEAAPEAPVTAPVAEKSVAEAPAAAEPEAEAPAAEEPAAVNFAEKTLAELVELFQGLGEGIERIKKSKEAEAIKSAFYKRLSKEKADAGLAPTVDEPSADSPVDELAAPQSGEDGVRVNPFEAIELGFKSIYNDYKKERAEFNRQLEKEREENLTLKKAVVEDLKNLLETQEDVNATFPAFREIQARWRAIGPVPTQDFRNINDSYQYYVEKFYDMVKINRDLRDLDFKKNLEAKLAFCEAAEKLSGNDNVVEAFRELQKLHEQWKEFGPVAKEYRDQIWERFKTATAVINKKYQAFFEGQKAKQVENLAAKQKLCEQVEAIAAKEVSGSNEWNALSKQIEDIQKQWKGIGFASKKDNQKIYDRFRAACDQFFEKKRVFYTEYKDSMNENLDKKMAIIEQAEALKTSTEWKKATDQFINLQKQWKEIGAVPRKKSDQLWKRFRAACDEFFAERDKQSKPENDFYSNLKAKRRVIDEINAYEPSADEEANAGAMKEFSAKWQAIGFVPFKEKDAINAAFREAMQAKFPEFGQRVPRGGGAPRAPRAPRTEKEMLIQQYNALQQDIVTYENNIGFFAQSKNAEPLIRQMQEKIEQSKQELKALEEKIRNTEDNG